MRDYRSSSNSVFWDFLQRQIGRGRSAVVRPRMWQAALDHGDSLTIARTLDRGARKCAAAYVEEDALAWIQALSAVIDEHVEALNAGAALAPGLVCQGVVLALLGGRPEVALHVRAALLDTAIRGVDAGFDAIIADILLGLLQGDETTVRRAAALLKARSQSKFYNRRMCLEGQALAGAAIAVLEQDPGGLAEAMASLDAALCREAEKQTTRWVKGRDIDLDILSFVSVPALGLVYFGRKAGLDVPWSPFFDLAWVAPCQPGSSVIAVDMGLGRL